MGVAAYKTSKDMSDELKKALPDVEALRKLSDGQGEEQPKQRDKPRRFPERDS